MCVPIAALAIGSTLLGVGGTVASYQGQRAQAAAARDAANANYRATFEALQARSREVSESQSEGSFDRAIEAARTQGLIAAKGSEQGLSATSLGAQIQTSAFESGRAQSLTARQAQLQQNQIGREIENANQAKVSELNANRGPSFASLLLGIGGAGLQGATTYAGLGGRLPGSGLRS